MANVTYKTGSLFQTPGVQIAVIPVNCVGVMGAGLARHAAEIEPRLAGSLRIARLKPGDFRLQPAIRTLVTVKFETFDLSYAFAATKDDWRNPSQIEWVESILKQMVQNTHLVGKTIGLPYLGCGLGGLSKTDVRKLFDQYLPAVACASILVIDQGRK